MMYNREFDITTSFRLRGTFEDSLGSYREQIALILFEYTKGTETEFGVNIQYSESFLTESEGPDTCITRLIVDIDGSCNDALDLEGFRVYLKGLHCCSLCDFESWNHDGTADDKTPFWVASVDDPEYYAQHKSQFAIA